jgi:hypothetical protein
MQRLQAVYLGLSGPKCNFIQAHQKNSGEPEPLQRVRPLRGGLQERSPGDRCGLEDMRREKGLKAICSNKKAAEKNFAANKV